MSALRWLADPSSAISLRLPGKHVDQLDRFKVQTARAGADHVQGLRHAYAWACDEALTGWKAPAAGGPSAKPLSPEQKATDRQARLNLSRELGHEQKQITAVHLGR